MLTCNPIIGIYGLTQSIKPPINGVQNYGYLFYVNSGFMIAYGQSQQLFGFYSTNSDSSNTSNTNSNNSGGSTALSDGAVAGIAIGSVIVAMVIIYFLYYNFYMNTGKLLNKPLIDKRETEVSNVRV